ncbi:MAG: TetR/AcrR family transcriptional regulator [Candidatus Krumholzibacteriia bacterium]
MTDLQSDTRSRLLEAAEQLFARHGFDGVSIRDIAAAAEVNVAAVNYHFQGKENLYREVLQQVVAGKRDRYLAALDAARTEQPGDLEAAVRAFFRAHFEDTLKTEGGGNFLKLFVREMHHGRPENARLIADLLIPMWADVGRAMLAGEPGLDPSVAQWIVGSLHGQLVHFTMRWHKTHLGSEGPVRGDDPFGPLKALFPPLAGDVDTYIDQAVDHITRFSVAGIQAVLAGHRSAHPEGDAS